MTELYSPAFCCAALQNWSQSQLTSGELYLLLRTPCLSLLSVLACLLVKVRDSLVAEAHVSEPGCSLRTMRTSSPFSVIPTEFLMLIAVKVPSAAKVQHCRSRVSGMKVAAAVSAPSAPVDSRKPAATGGVCVCSDMSSLLCSPAALRRWSHSHVLPAFS